MKSGPLNVFLVLVAAFVILTVANIIYRTLNKDYETETALLSTGIDSEQVKGVFIRDEQVITYDGDGVISYEISDGGKLGIGSVIAGVYPSESQIELKQRIASLETELSLLRRISNPGTTQTAQPSGISELFDQTYMEYLFQREQRNYDDLQREEMVVLLSTYQLVTGMDTGYEDKISQLESELNTLKQAQQAPLKTITADRAAYFVSYADGYEDTLRTDSISSLTPDQLSEVKDAPSNADGVVGKLIDSYQWMLAAVVDNSDKFYEKGKWVTLKFSSTSEQVRGQIVSVNSDAGNTKTVIVISCETMTYDLVQHRTETVEIIRGVGEYTGIMVPRSAQHFSTVTDPETGEEETVVGVYVLNGEQPEFRRLDVIYGDTDHVISAQHEEEGYLQLYDSIITKGIDADGQ